MATGKQILANRKNAKLGGVKTEKGKAISRFNAFKHGILSDAITEYDKEIFNSLHKRLIKENKPKTAIEEIVVERIALSYLRLMRVARVEKEYILSLLYPTIKEPLLDISSLEEKIIKKGKEPIIPAFVVEEVWNKFIARYETSLENRLYKALHELERLQRSRKGENIPPPLTVDVDVSKED
jgi:hypothetical protein